MLSRLSAALARLIPPVQAARTGNTAADINRDFERQRPEDFQKRSAKEESSKNSSTEDEGSPDQYSEDSTPEEQAAAPNIQVLPLPELTPFQLRTLRFTHILVSMIQSLRSPKAKPEQAKAGYETAGKAQRNKAQLSKGSIIDRKAG